MRRVPKDWPTSAEEELRGAVTYLQPRICRGNRHQSLGFTREITKGPMGMSLEVGFHNVSSLGSFYPRASKSEKIFCSFDEATVT